MTDREGSGIPWWSAAIDNPVPRARISMADLWDALFGRMETFCRVEHDGSWFICEPHEVDDWNDGDSTVYTITQVRMTRRQFNQLPEFEGF